MSESTSNEPVKVEGNKLIVVGKPGEAKVSFFSKMENRVKRLSADEYKTIAGARSAHGYFGATISKVPEGKQIQDAMIYVNEDDFRVGGVDYTDLIPIVVRHEISELWAYAKTGYSLSPKPESLGKTGRVEIGHGLALREEYRYASEIGKLERYREFMHKWVEERKGLSPGIKEKIISENEEAYQRAKSRFERKA